MAGYKSVRVRVLLAGADTQPSRGRFDGALHPQLHKLSPNRTVSYYAQGEGTYSIVATGHGGKCAENYAQQNSDVDGFRVGEFTTSTEYVTLLRAIITHVIDDDKETYTGGVPEVAFLKMENKIYSLEDKCP